MEYDFVLKFKVPDGSSSELAESLGEAGCDDAVLGMGQPGRIALDFTRDAGSAQQAIISALEDVKRAVPDAALIEASPDLVGLTDIAELVGVTRQNMRKLVMTHPKTFPAPIHDGSLALWHLAPVLEWLVSRAGYEISPRLIEVSRAAMQINVAKEASRLAAPRLAAPVQSRIRALVV